MNALILFAAAGLFAAGATAGIISVATLAIRREEKYLTLTSAATDRLTRAGRWLNGVGVRAPCRPDALPYPLEFKLLEEDWDGVLTPDLARSGEPRASTRPTSSTSGTDLVPRPARRAGPLRPGG